MAEGHPVIMSPQSGVDYSMTKLSPSANSFKHHIENFSFCIIYPHLTHLPLLPPDDYQRRQFSNDRLLCTLRMTALLFIPHAVNCWRLFLVPSVCFICLQVKYLGNQWTDLRQIHTQDVFGPSIRWVWQSRSKVKVTRDKNGIFRPFGGLCAVYVW